MSARQRLIALIPLGVLAAATAFFVINVMTGAPKRPSALIGKEAPPVALAEVSGAGLPGLASSDFKGGVTLVNFWASWCPPCRLEHQMLMSLAQRGDISLVGIDWKDDPATAKAYLEHLGNPYARLGWDGNGKVGIDWGIGGVPETFVIGPDGRVMAHFEGPLTPKALDQLGIGN